MSDAKAICDKNALEAISFLIGQWSVEVRYSTSGPVNGAKCTLLPKPGGKGHATFQRLNSTTVSGEYHLSVCSPDQSKAIVEWRLELTTDPLQESLVCRFAGNATSPSSKGIPRQSGIHFVCPNQEPSMLSKALCLPGIPVSESPLSIIIRKGTDTPWLLAVCITLADKSVILAEYWYTLDPSPDLTFSTESNLRSLDQATDDLKEVKEDIEEMIDEIDELSAGLDDARAALGEKAKLLQELPETIDTARAKITDADVDLADAIADEHLRATTHGLHEPESAETTDPLGDALSDFYESQDEAESLPTEIDELKDAVEDMVASICTNALYMMGQRALQKYQPTDDDLNLSFLDPYGAGVDTLSEDARKILKSALLHQSIAKKGHFARDMDFGWAVASMAKCLERVFADAFRKHKTAVTSDPTVERLLTEAKKWEFEIPPEEATVDKTALCRVLGIIKQERLEWSGPRNCGLALLLFSGRISFRKGMNRETIRPLDISWGEVCVRVLHRKLIEFQGPRNRFVHGTPKSLCS